MQNENSDIDNAVTGSIKAPGRTVMIYYVTDQWHASGFTFTDEEEIREKWLYPEVKKGDVFLDIGAAYGSYAVGALACGASKVICFSPQFEYGVLLRNLELNTNKEFQSYKAYSLGLYSKKGYLTTFTQKFSETYDEATIGFNGETENDTIIRVTTLDQMVLPTDRIDIMKLDVEGAEVHVLQGARKMIEYYKPRVILVENHNFKVGGIQEEVITLMSTFDVTYVPEIYTGPGLPDGVSHTRFKLL